MGNLAIFEIQLIRVPTWISTGNVQYNADRVIYIGIIRIIIFFLFSVVVFCQVLRTVQPTDQRDSKSDL